MGLAASGPNTVYPVFGQATSVNTTADFIRAALIGVRRRRDRFLPGAGASVGGDNARRIAPNIAAKSGAKAPSQPSGASMGSPSARCAKADYGVVFFIGSPPPAGRVSDSVSAFAA